MGINLVDVNERWREAEKDRRRRGQGWSTVHGEVIMVMIDAN